MATCQQKNTSKNIQLVVLSKVQSDLEPSYTSRRSPAPVQSWCEVTQAHYLSSAPGLGRQKIKLVWYLCISYKKAQTLREKSGPKKLGENNFQTRFESWHSLAPALKTWCVVTQASYMLRGYVDLSVTRANIIESKCYNFFVRIQVNVTYFWIVMIVLNKKYIYKAFCTSFVEKTTKLSKEESSLRLKCFAG